MNSWTECVSRWLTWRGALPRQLHLRGLYIHVSTLLALPPGSAGHLSVAFLFCARWPMECGSLYHSLHLVGQRRCQDLAAVVGNQLARGF